MRSHLRPTMARPSSGIALADYGRPGTALMLGSSWRKCRISTGRISASRCGWRGVQDPLIAILEPRRDGPGRIQFLAAEQFRRDTALADGVRGENEHLGVSGGTVNGGPTQVMIEAQEQVRRAWLAIRGPQNEADVADVVRLVVLGWATLERIDAARRVRRHTARAMLLIGLERLAIHYGLTRREGGGSV